VVEPTASLDDRMNIGRAERERRPLGSHTDWGDSSDDRDGIGLLEAGTHGALQHLVPTRWGRMP